MRQLIRLAIPAALLLVVVFPLTPRTLRLVASALLLAYWSAIYIRYRRENIVQTTREWDLLRSVSWEAFWRHYNERVPTVEEEFEIWGPYHQHRHEMRYDICAEAVRRHIKPGAVLFDLGCGSANVADRLADLPIAYIGMEFNAPNMAYAATKFAHHTGPMSVGFLRGDAEALPLASSSVDVIVMSEVIEHLLRPEKAVWEIARVLRLGGTLVVTTNNASEVPLRSPLSHLFAWLEKAIGASLPSAISLRPWIWPEKVHEDLLPPGSPDIYLPHTHHISAQTRQMFATAGLDTVRWGSFEFPPPQSKTADWFAKRGMSGLRMVDALEAVASRLPLIRRLGTHLLIVSRRSERTPPPSPPRGIWPGPLSGGKGSQPVAGHIV